MPQRSCSLTPIWIWRSSAPYQALSGTRGSGATPSAGSSWSGRSQRFLTSRRSASIVGAREHEGSMPATWERRQDSAIGRRTRSKRPLLRYSSQIRRSSRPRSDGEAVTSIATQGLVAISADPGPSSPQPASAYPPSCPLGRRDPRAEHVLVCGRYDSVAGAAFIIPSVARRGATRRRRGRRRADGGVWFACAAVGSAFTAVGHALMRLSPRSRCRDGDMRGGACSGGVDERTVAV
jgi:hypothetical protein